MIESILQFDNVGMLPGIYYTQFKGRVLSEHNRTRKGQYKTWTMDSGMDQRLDSGLYLHWNFDRQESKVRCISISSKGLSIYQ